MAFRLPIMATGKMTFISPVLTVGSNCDSTDASSVFECGVGVVSQVATLSLLMLRKESPSGGFCAHLQMIVFS